MRITLPFLVSTLVGTSLGFLACGASNHATGRHPGDEDSGFDVPDSQPPPPDVIEGGTTLEGGFVEAPHTPFPQVENQGGQLILAPQLVTVTFPGDSLSTDLVAFGKTVEESLWWTTVTSKYCQKGSSCIVAGATPTSVVYPSAPASSYTDSTQGGGSTLKTWLANAISSGALPAPADEDAGTNAMSNTLYLLYFPDSTSISLDGMSGCSNAEGYHAAMIYNGIQVPYAVISECPGSGMETPPITTLQGTTITASHEIVEAATDPSDLNNDTGYYLNQNDPGTYGWDDIEGGELADLCVDVFNFGQDEWNEGGFTVQRIWSNEQAAAGLDPCAPITTSSVYFNSVPVQSFFVMDVGSTITFEVDAFSVGPRSDWRVTAQDWSDYTTNPYLSFTIAGGKVDQNIGPVVDGINNGSKIQVSMTLEQDPSCINEADGVILSFLGEMTAAPASYFAFSVMTPGGANAFGLDASLSTSSHRPRPKRATRASTSLELVPAIDRARQRWLSLGWR
jgi:hypothetical protein